MSLVRWRIELIPLTPGHGSELADLGGPATMGAMRMIPQRRAGFESGRCLALQVVVLLSIAGGCAPPRSPADVSAAWLDAVAGGRLEDARGLMAAQTLSNAHLAELDRRARQMSNDDRARLRAAPTEPTVRKATWRTSAGALTFETRGSADGRWILTGPLPSFDRQDTPVAALQTMRRAIRHNDFELLLRLAPAAERDRLSAPQLRNRFDDPTFRSSTLAALDALLQVGEGDDLGDAGDGHRWRFQSGRHRAELTLEKGRWRVADLR